MEFNNRLNEICLKKNSLVCVGLDVDLAKVPAFVLKNENPQLYFSQAIIDATSDHTAAYKINTAFYEAYGVAGWKALTDIIRYIPQDIIIIADAKRGDIGNTSKMYAKAFFEELGVDAITVNPYLGRDAVAPFIENDENGAFILCHTTNKGAEDFQKFGNGDKKLFEVVAESVNDWNGNNNCGLVVGATFPQEIKNIRTRVPDLPLLIPGLGAQGGNFDLSIKYALNQNKTGAIFNFSRSIIYASQGIDFAETANQQAKQMQELINSRRIN